MSTCQLSSGLKSIKSAEIGGSNLTNRLTANYSELLRKQRKLRRVNEELNR